MNMLKGGRKLRGGTKLKKMVEHVYKQEVEKMDIEGRHEIASARFSAYLCHRISATKMTKSTMPMLQN